MRRVLVWSLRVVLVLIVVVGTVVGMLAATTPRPRETAAWDRLADVPRPRGEVAVAVTVEHRALRPGERAPIERLWVIGGIAGLGRTVDDVDVYHPDTDRWDDGPALPAARDHAAAAAIGSAVHVTGGSARATASSGETDHWVLRENAASWETLADLPEPRTGHALVAIGERLFVVGGAGSSARVLIFEDGRWTTGAAMPIPRDHLVSLVVDGRIWAIGGRSGFRDVLDRVDIYDPEADAWSPGPALPSPMSAMAGGIVDDAIHVVGGEHPTVIGGGVLDRHVRLVPGEDRWADAPRPVVAVHGSPGGVLRGRLHVAGGARRQGMLSVLGWTGVLQVFPSTAGSG